ncbi:MAG TPA: WYL domain-containing protein [Deltaproteobacteria bacterium]|nr:WYL domain-containing protein [Deltaproteobacteria bacterium]
MVDNSHRTVTRRLMRLGRILRIFLERESASTSWISRDLGVNARTIQRDLKALKCAGIPINEEKKGLYRLDKNLLKDLEVFDDAELALIVALKDMVSQLGKPFERAADDLLGRICDYTACRPVYIKVKSDLPLSGKTMSRIIKAIQGGRQISFYYQGRSSHGVTAEPYRIAYFDGVWYLVARDTDDRIIKKYILDNLSDIRVLRTASKAVPTDLDETLERSVNIWFSGERSMEVIIEVDAAWAHYFQRRWILPLQEVTELKDDGSILVRFFACSVEEVMMCLKPWLPHVRVLQPAEVAEQMLGDFQTWAAWQGAAW